MIPMKTKRTRVTEITVERSELFLINKIRREIFILCAQCAERARMLTPDEAALAAGVAPRTIYSWVEVGRVHFVETPEGNIYICQRSLAR